jgi:hypothetical protein
MRPVKVAEARHLRRVMRELQIRPGDQVDESHVSIQAVRKLAAPYFVELVDRHVRQGVAPEERMQ